jgi:hypothetical protein
MISSFGSGLQCKHKYINIMEKCSKKKDKMGLKEEKGGP